MKTLTHGVIRTAMLLGINISNSSLQKKKDSTVKDDPEEIVGEVVEVAEGYKDMDLEESQSVKEEYVEFKQEEISLEKKIKVDPCCIDAIINNKVTPKKISNNLQCNKQKRAMKKEKHLQDILLRSREIVRATIGPIRTASSTPTNTGGHYSIHQHHPYAWWGNSPYTTNLSSYARGMYMSSFPNLGRGLLGSQPKEGFDHHHHWN